MTTNDPMAANDFCPYKGLQPYTEQDQAYFFGRERDTEIITSNLYAAPLTILYGESGVGKSSVLMAGVLPQLRTTPHLAVVIFRTWQDAAFLTTLKKQLLEAASASTGKTLTIDPTLALDDFLFELARALRGNVFCILDQFEEYFLYHEPTAGDEGFDAELARAINRREVTANFLICLREDSLSKLDRFKGRIPNLLGNVLRLVHLDNEAAASAIRKPLEEYNRHLSPGQSPMSIEPELVQAVIAQVRTGQVMPGAGTSAQTDASEETSVETPYLQLVMTRLWEQERAANSNTLRLATLKRLGGAQQIVRTHLDATMGQFTHAERLTAARAFRFLVTPSGTKIAYTASDLATYAAVPLAQLTPVLRKLSGSEVRVLRAVTPPGGEGQEPRYEIFHDVLAPAILDWRERYLREERGKQYRRAFLALGGASALIIAILIAISLFSRQEVQTSSQTARLAVGEALLKGAEAQTAQAQSTVAQQTGVAVGARATLVAKERATRDHVDAVRSAQTSTAEALQVAQTDQTQEARAQVAGQAAQTQAANAAALSLEILGTPGAPSTATPTGHVPSPPSGARATAIAVATSAAQILKFTVTDVQVQVSNNSSSNCPAQFTFTGVITANQAGTVTFQWQRSDGSLVPSNRIVFTRAGSVKVTDTWTVEAALSGWEQLSILTPNPLTSNQVTFSLQPIMIPGVLQAALAKNNAASVQLGCPMAPAQATDTTQQAYQNGLMIWHKDAQNIYVLLNTGSWLGYHNTWDTSQPEYTCGGPPSPPQPIRGFGKIWCTQPNVARGIGVATTPEVTVTLQVQTFENGLALIDPDGGIKVLFSNGPLKGTWISF